jgi:hypothetical protein
LSFLLLLLLLLLVAFLIIIATTLSRQNIQALPADCCAACWLVGDH